MKDKSQNPRKVFSNSDIYAIHSEVKAGGALTTHGRILSGLMGNYLK